MNKRCMYFIKGLGIGLTVGSACAMIGKIIIKSRRHPVKSGAKKALKTVSHAIDGMMSFF